MTDYMPSSDGLARSTLRETIKRIRRIRSRAGRDDDNEEEFTSTGDPFRDFSLAFIRCVKRTKAAIVERNEGAKKHGQDRMTIEQSVGISREIRTLETLIGEMVKFVDASEAALMRETRKAKPKQQKLALLERQRDERLAQYKECVSTLELVRELDAQRVSGEKKEPDITKECLVGRKAQLREQLLGMRRPRNGDNSHADPNEGIELQDNTVGGGERLETHEDTKEAMKTIAAQDAKIDAGIDRLRLGVGRLHELAREIGVQLDVQNHMLEKTERTMDKQMNQLRVVNSRIRKFVKETKPMNTFLNVCCVVLILSLLGFFLVQFNVI